MATAANRAPLESATHGLTNMVQQKLGERRFYALAEAIREHEARAREEDGVSRVADQEMYHRFRLICGEL